MCVSDIKFVMPGTRGGPQRVVECASDTTHMGHAIEPRLTPDEMERQVIGNVTKMAKELSAFHAHTGYDWRQSQRMIAIGGPDYKCRATPVRLPAVNKCDAVLRRASRKLGFVLATTPRAVLYTPTAAGGYGFESSRGARSGALIDENLRTLQLAIGEPALTVSAARLFRTMCRHGYLPKLTASSVFDMPPNLLTGSPSTGLAWDNVLFAMRDLGIWWKPSGLLKCCAIDPCPALLEPETEDCPYAHELGIVINNRLKAMGIKFIPDDLYFGGRIITEGELQAVYAGDDFNLTNADKHVISTLLSDLRRMLNEPLSSTSQSPTLLAVRARWHTLCYTQPNPRPELLLAILMNSPVGAYIHTIAAAAKYPDYVPSTRTHGLPPDEWHVRTLRDDWCGAEGKFMRQAAIDKLLRRSKADDAEKRRVRMLQDEAVLIPEHLEADARGVLGDEIVDSAYGTTQTLAKSACLMALTEHLVLDYSPRKNHPLDNSRHVPFDDYHADLARRSHSAPNHQTAFPTRAEKVKVSGTHEYVTIQKPSADLPEEMQLAGVTGVALSSSQARDHAPFCLLVNFDPSDFRLWSFDTLGRTNTYVRHHSLLSHPVLRLFVRTKCAEMPDGKGLSLGTVNGSASHLRVKIDKSELNEYDVRADKLLIAEMARVTVHGNIRKWYASDGSRLHSKVRQNTTHNGTGIYSGPTAGTLPENDYLTCTGFGVHHSGDIDQAEMLGALHIRERALELAVATYGADPPHRPNSPWGVGQLGDSDSCLKEIDNASRQPDGEYLMRDPHAQLIETIMVHDARLIDVYNCTIYSMRIPGHGKKALGLGTCTPMMYADAAAKASTRLPVIEPTLLSRRAPFILTSLANHGTPLADCTPTAACTPAGAIFRFARERAGIQYAVSLLTSTQECAGGTSDSSDDDGDKDGLLLARYRLPISREPFAATTIWWQSVLDLTMQGTYCHASVIADRPNALAIIGNLIGDSEISKDWY